MIRVTLFTLILAMLAGTALAQSELHDATVCDMDFNANGVVDIDDLTDQLACIMENGPCVDEMDTDNNTVVNRFDMQYVLANIGASCP